MQEALYRQTAAIEERHWWFLHRRRVVEALLRRYRPDLSTVCALDVGCGGGGNVRWLERRGAWAIGIDRSPLALEIARRQGPRSLLARVDVRHVDACFAASSFDLVTVFNVLYHRWVDDVGAVLSKLGTLLRSGGLLIVNEPALPMLSRRHDEIGYGARRFRRRELQGMLVSAGFEPLRLFHLGVAAVPPALMLAWSERLRDALLGPPRHDTDVSEMKVPAAALNRCILAAGGAERFWIRAGLPTPWGVALLAVARRVEG